MGGRLQLKVTLRCQIPNRLGVCDYRSSRGGALPEALAMEKYLVEGEATFEPETVSMLSKVLDEAWRSLQHTGVYITSLAHAEATRENLAKRIIKMAAHGERDPISLREDALENLARSKLAQLRPRGSSL